MRAPPSVAGAAVVLLTGSVIAFLGCLLMFGNAVESYRLAGQVLSGLVNARLFAFFILPVSFALLGIVASVGLFGMRQWARKVAIFLSVAPVVSCALLVGFRPEAVFPSDTGSKYAILTIGSMGIVMYTFMLVILTPLSAWWLILFTRESVRSQFRSH